MHSVPAHKQLDPAKQPGQIVALPVFSHTTDFTFQNHGSIVLLTALSQSARAWCNEYLPDDCPRFGLSYAIETRFFGDILDGIDADGLAI